jgi:flagellar FliJ protein
MPKFVFQLEGALRQRKQLERMKQREMAVVQAEMNKLQDQLRALEGTVQTATADVRGNRLTGVLDMSFLAAHRRFMIATQRQSMELVQKMALVQRQLDEARLAVAEAAKQRKIIEKLREKQFERWKAERSKKELAELDEVSMQLSYWHGGEDDEELGEIAT